MASILPIYLHCVLCGGGVMKKALKTLWYCGEQLLIIGVWHVSSAFLPTLGSGHGGGGVW